MVLTRLIATYVTMIVDLNYIKVSSPNIATDMCVS